jgi:hypothetical protein
VGARSTHTRSRRDDLSQAEEKAKQKKNEILSSPKKKREETNKHGNVKGAHSGSHPPRRLDSDRALLNAQCPRMSGVGRCTLHLQGERQHLMWMWTENEKKERKHSPHLADISTCNCLRAYPSSDHACHPSSHPAPYPLWRWYHVRGAHEAQPCRTYPVARIR